MSASQHESNEDFTNVETHGSGPFPMRTVGYLASSFFRKTNTNKYELIGSRKHVQDSKNGKPQRAQSGTISRRQYYLDDCSPRLYYLTTISVSRF